jgi:hypothetical protein
MFTHLLHKDAIPFSVGYSQYAKRHYLKRFQKDCPGRQWTITEEGIFEDLSRITYPDQDLQQTQQIDELWHKDEYWVLKYDFKIAGKKESAKDSGNRLVAFLDSSKKTIEILLVYGKGDLPKNMKESQFVTCALSDNFSEYLAKCR